MLGTIVHRIAFERAETRRVVLDLRCGSHLESYAHGIGALATFLGRGIGPFTWRATNPFQQNSKCPRR